jgi:Na+-translocating ferredoxin:NAD+ oxidoreductase RnfC subunit
MDIHNKIRNAGVVGAGGAGFPTHVKAESHVDTVIANGAECEPLLHKDYELMVHHAEKVVTGMKLMMQSTGAKEGIVGIKEKNVKAIDAFQKVLDDGMRLHLLGDFYPSGDEFILVYEATKRLIPPQGIPLNIGVVVNNVETFYNVALAAEDRPVTEKFITVSGAVKNPVTCIVPIGTSFSDAIEMAGGASVDDFGVFVSGIMMGKLEFDLDEPITKTCAGLIVLPKTHKLIERKDQPESSMHRIGKSACDQCSYCTELCPRYILGYDIQPHKVMRSLGFTKTGEDLWSQYAQLCCGCGLCTLYACPESLFPKEACDKSKRDLKEKGIPWSGKMNVEPHPMYEGRRTPIKQLIKRLGVTEYDRHTEFVSTPPQIRKVTIPLTQHVGTSSRAVVAVGESVKKGQVIGEIPEGKLGARIHASIDGVVRGVASHVVIETS